MTLLAFDDTSRRGQVRLPPVQEIAVYLVGTGGTGSHLAMSLARLAYHARTKGVRVHLTFVDPDRVEMKNVGRQLFCPAEVGQFKAETLALRLNAAFGLDIRAIAHPLETVANTLLAAAPATQLLVMGAVDNHKARQSIHQMVTQQPAWWCDAGNEAHAGRVFMGNQSAADMQSVTGLDALGWCQGLPLPSVQDPDLLQPEPPTPTVPLSCADLTAQDAQSLMMNQIMAAVAAQYATDFVLHRHLTTYRTVISLDPPTVTSSLITENVLATFGVLREPNNT